MGEVDPFTRLGVYLAHGFLIALCLGPLYTLAYTLSDRLLYVGFGAIGMRVPLDTIESVTPGYGKGLTWSWAMSLKGLLIARRGKRWPVFIAPLHQDAFLHELAARCPHLELRDGGLSPHD
tara:strand:+ start:220 stop:582 length:363 start_codon:yes stop_codon:yes gene_type:complete